MAKKLFLKRERTTPNTQAPSISREEAEEVVASSSRNNHVSKIREQLPYMILDETSKSFPKFNASGRSLLIKFRAPGEEQNPTAYLKESITALTNYLVNGVDDRDLVGLRIRNTENLQDKVVAISFRRRDKLQPDEVWGVLGKVTQSNARFGFVDRLEVHLDHVRMPAGNGGVKTKGRSLDVMSAIKKSIVTVTAVINCLAHALIIAIARVNGVPKYKSYRNGRGMKKPVEDLLKASGVDLSNGGGFKELEQFQEYFSDYKIIFYDGLNPGRVMFSGNSVSTKKLYLLYDEDKHYNVIINLKGASIYVMRVTLSMTLRINVTKLVPCALLHHPVRRIRLSILQHVTGGFSVRNVSAII